MRPVQCALFMAVCSLRSAHCALLNALCSMRSAHCALLNALCSMRSAHGVLPLALCSLRSAQCALLTAHCALLTALCAMRSAHCALLNALCSLRSAHCALRNALCSMRSAQCALLNESPPLFPGTEHTVTRRGRNRVAIIARGEWCSTPPNRHRALLTALCSMRSAHCALLNALNMPRAAFLCHGLRFYSQYYQTWRWESGSWADTVLAFIYVNRGRAWAPRLSAAWAPRLSAAWRF